MENNNLCALAWRRPRGAWTAGTRDAGTRVLLSVHGDTLIAIISIADDAIALRSSNKLRVCRCRRCTSWRGTTIMDSFHITHEAHSLHAERNAPG
eukprot:4881225-Pleurochrysis_carterae.AAC.5